MIALLDTWVFKIFVFIELTCSPPLREPLLICVRSNTLPTVDKKIEKTVVNKNGSEVLAMLSAKTIYEPIDQVVVSLKL